MPEKLCQRICLDDQAVADVGTTRFPRPLVPCVYMYVACAYVVRARVCVACVSFVYLSLFVHRSLFSPVATLVSSVDCFCQVFCALLCVESVSRKFHSIGPYGCCRNSGCPSLHMAFSNPTPQTRCLTKQDPVMPFHATCSQHALCTPRLGRKTLEGGARQEDGVLLVPDCRKLRQEIVRSTCMDPMGHIRPDYVSYVAAPIFADGAPLGNFCVFSRKTLKELGWTAHHTAVLRGLADAASTEVRV